MCPREEVRWEVLKESCAYNVFSSITVGSIHRSGARCVCHVGSHGFPLGVTLLKAAQVCQYCAAEELACFILAGAAGPSHCASTALLACVVQSLRW